MGINIDDIFGKAKAAAEQGMNDLLKTGGNAALGFLEGQAIAILHADKQQHEQAAQQSAQEILNRPSSPFGDYVSNIMKNPVLNNYGGPIIFGIVGVLLIGALVYGKGK